MKDLSIVIPVYNSDKYLKRCLDSVNLLKGNVKIILVDDGSTDCSGEICNLYAKENDRFSVIHKLNEGLVLARKSGFDAVKTEYFTFVDSDDYIDAEAYNDMFNKWSNSAYDNADIFCFGMTEEYMGNCCLKRNSFPNGTYTGTLLSELCSKMLSKGDFFNFGLLPNAVCKMYKTSFVKNNFPSISSNVKIGEDADMTFQLLLKAKEVVISDYVSYHYCRRENSMMWNKVESEAIDCLEKDLMRAFERNAKYKEKLLKQLKDYMAFISLLCEPQRVLGDDPFFMKTEDRIALYGAGGVGKAIRFGMDNKFSLWVDKNITDNNLKIFPIDILISKKDCYDKVFIANSNTLICKEIKKSLISLGVDKPIYYFRENV